eukprot:253704_1
MMALSIAATSNICAIVLMVLSIFMLLLVINFYRLRSLREIASRRPKSSLIAGILCTGANLIVLPASLFYLNNINMPHIPWVGTFIHLGMMLTCIAPYHIFTFRAWMVYFDIKFNQTLDAQQWRLYIDPEETNWFLKRRHTWGNEKRVAFVMFMHWAIFTVIVCGLVILNGHRGSPLSRIFLGLGGIDPMILDIYLYFKFPKFNDVWGIHNEIMSTLRAELLQQIVYYFMVIGLKFEYFTNLYTITVTYVGVTTLLFVLVIHLRVFQIFQLPALPWGKVQWTKDREHMGSLSSVSDNGDVNVRDRGASDGTMNLGVALADKHGFNEFARQLTREFCVENLLFFVETHQWQLSLAGKEQYSCFDTPTLMNVQLAENAPKSKIIQSDKRSSSASKGKETECEFELPSDDEFLEGIRLFNKYITNSAYFVLNISSQYRKMLYKAFMYDEKNAADISEEEWVKKLKESRNMDRKVLFNVFNDTRAEIWYLLLHSYIRFKQTEAFAKVVQKMQMPEKK